MSNNMSSRVKSMKFMQKSNSKEAKIEEENQGLKDQSEWVTSDSRRILQKKGTHIKTIGYASINSFTAIDDFDDDFTPAPIRRVYENENTKTTKTTKTTKIDKNGELPDEFKEETNGAVGIPKVEDDMQALWNKNKVSNKNNKRKMDGKDNKTSKKSKSK